MGNTGEKVVGDDAPLASPSVVEWRLGVERLVREASGRKIRGVVIRPGMVYGRGGGELAGFVRQARESGVVKYVGTGENHWSFVHVDALARLYVMALEKAGAGVMLVATNGPPLRVREVAEAAARLGGSAARAEPWPLEEARKQIGPMADGMVLDQRIAGTRARQLLGWNPEAPSVLVELSRGSYT
jgi:nucleoside-diphosphate-sugar epimerase